MQLILMVIATFIIAYVFHIGFFPAAIIGVIIGTILWTVVQAFFQGGQQPTQTQSTAEKDEKDEAVK